MKVIESSGFDSPSRQFIEKCPCGSGAAGRLLSDARGIPVGYVCDKCEEAIRAKYRPDIFTDSNYWTDEQIEPDY